MIVDLKMEANGAERNLMELNKSTEWSNPIKPPKKTNQQIHSKSFFENE